MAQFLSPAWLEQLAAAARDTADLPADAALTVQQVVRGGPEGEVAWYVELTGGRARLSRGWADQAQVTIIEDYPTAVALGRGAISPATAFASGRLRVGGQVGLLVRHQEALAALHAAVAHVQRATTYP